MEQKMVGIEQQYADAMVALTITRESVKLLQGRLADEKAEHANTIAEWTAERNNLIQRAESAEHRLAEVEQEARRYRWLRDDLSGSSWYDSGMGFIAPDSVKPNDMLTAVALDAAIDAAIKESAAQEEDR